MISLGNDHVLVDRAAFGLALLIAVTRNRDCADAERVSELSGDLLELHHAFRVRLLVNAINRRVTGLFKMRGHRFVGGQHELLDNPVGDVARAARDAGHDAGFVEFDQRLREVEVDRAALVALVLQNFSQLAHQLEAFDERRRNGLSARDRLQAADARSCTSCARRCESRRGRTRNCRGSPCRSNSMSAETTSRSAWGISEQMLVESSNGSMGTARSGK